MWTGTGKMVGRRRASLSRGPDPARGRRARAAGSATADRRRVRGLRRRGYGGL